MKKILSICILFLGIAILPVEAHIVVLKKGYVHQKLKVKYALEDTSGIADKNEGLSLTVIAEKDEVIMYVENESTGEIVAYDAIETQSTRTYEVLNSGWTNNNLVIEIGTNGVIVSEF